MSKKVIRFTGSPDCDPATWLRINHITEQPGPGSAYRVTIEPIEAHQEPEVWEWHGAKRWVAGIKEQTWENLIWSETCELIQAGTVALGFTREDALAKLAKAKARGPL
jgi:hypothetical protein